VKEREGATVTRTLGADVEAVTTVLADPRAYDGVVVGSRRIRWFDPSWPAPGARFHHTLGFGPVTIRDHTEVLEEDLPRRLRLLVHLRPVGSAEVEFRLSAEGDRTHVAMTETPVSGALARAWSPPLAAATRWRNDRVLARLEEVAQGRARSMARATARRDTDAAAAPRPGGQATTADAGRNANEAGDG
jgi:hypothetical protein